MDENLPLLRRSPLLSSSIKLPMNSEKYLLVKLQEVQVLKFQEVKVLELPRVAAGAE